MVQLPSTSPFFHIVIVGAGATGSNLLPSLLQFLNQKKNKGHKVTIIDGDIYEERNKENQKCTDEDILSQKSKAQIMCEVYQDLYPDLSIDYLGDYINSVKEILQITDREQNSSVDTYTILVSCVDNDNARRIFYELFHDEASRNLVYIDSGNGTDKRVGQVVVGYKQTTKKQCKDRNGNYDYYCTGDVHEVILPCVGDIYDDIIKNTEGRDWAHSCEAGQEEHPQNIATNVMAACTLFTVLVNLIAFGKITKNMYFFDADNIEILGR